MFLYTSHNRKPFFFQQNRFLATVLEKPVEKSNSYKSVLRITHYFEGDSLISTNEKVIAYFSKTTGFIMPAPGEIIDCRRKPVSIKNNGNPFEFDYQKYLEHQKIYRQVFLDEGDWATTGNKKFTTATLAEEIRERLLAIYRTQPFSENEFEILSALTLGYKRELDPETKRVFASAGAIHVMAVSGLHVGIVFWTISLLIGFLRNRKTGRIFFVLISIGALWTYAFITGLSPSVTRASAMFTIYIIGDNLNRRSEIYNSLAASAFLLLLVNPNFLFDTGFQLSYSAVFGIVFLQPRFARLANPQNRATKFLWTLLTVSVAAQVTTAPLVIWYFHQFPVYFWLTNLVVIPAVMLLIPLGITLLAVSGATMLAAIISRIAGFIIHSIYSFLFFVEKLPASVLPVTVNPVEHFFLIAALSFFLIFLVRFKLKTLMISVFFLLSMAVASLFFNLSQINRKEIIVYNSPGNTVVQLIRGRKNYIFSEKIIKPDDFILNQILQANQMLRLSPPEFLQVNIPFENQDILIRNHMIFFEGKTIAVHPAANVKSLRNHIDFVINPEVKEIFGDKTEIIFTDKVKSNSTAYKNTGVHSTLQNGAFRKIW